MSATTHDFQRDILHQTAHRPWPMPESPWIMTQTWHRVLFAHWAVPAGALRARVPAQLPLDTHEGRAWVGIVAFEITNMAPRGIPALPLLSAFPEINVRTYVTLDGKPGVYFFSLDASSALAVWGARTFFHLPYFRARMSVREIDNEIAYRSHRVTGGQTFDARYGAHGASRAPTPGSLEYFLTERYCLYTLDAANKARRVDIHHPPWPLQGVHADIRANTMTPLVPVEVSTAPALLHYAARQDVVNWPLAATEDR